MKICLYVSILLGLNIYVKAVSLDLKSSICKYLCAKHGALICSGKAADIKYLIIKYKEKNGNYPEIILYEDRCR